MVGAGMSEAEIEGFEEWPAEADLIRMAALPLIEHIFAVTADGSAERKAAMDVALAAIERLKRALAPKPTIN
jgi:hypothetical protein